ncbi:MAG: phenylalanine--tRNA ligase subunit beta [Deinococcota bacterium]
MRVPFSWLEEFLPELQAGLLDRFMAADKPDTTTLAFQPISELSQLLNGIGLEVDIIDVLPGAPSGVVVARVDEVHPIEGSDHLLKTQVSTASSQHTVVTGAPNTKAGMLTALAVPGTHLPAMNIIVDAREMMGVPSEGVLCSPKELGLYDYAGGLIEFGDDLNPGDALDELWPIETVIELEITPNRADAFSLLGVARDIAAKLGIALHHPAEGISLADTSVETGYTVRVDDPETCPRFTLAVIEGVKVAPSPLWLQRKLAAMGLRPRNNIVDITNYVTFELGHPSHAFDGDALVDKTLVVRNASKGEQLRTLNDDELTLSNHDVVISMPTSAGSQDTEAISLAGVIGGLNDSVTDGTRNVALELAHWNPVTIRKTAKRYGISTDAHYRFERGVDPNLPPTASARAAQLIAELAGGTRHPGFVDVGGPKPLQKVSFRPERVKFLMDLEVPEADQKRYLTALGCTVDDSAMPWQVTAPSWRFDIALEEDLIEEVSRMQGYDGIPDTIPQMSFVPPEHDVTHRTLRGRLAAMGFQETITYAFTGPSELAAARAPEATVVLSHPQGVERSVLRTALYPGLLAAAKNNQREDGLALFEVGRVFAEHERECLTLLIQGTWVTGSWLAPTPVDFYVFKGLLEAFAELSGSEIVLEPASADSAPHLHPGVSARVYWQQQDGELRDVGYMGRVHPRVAAAFDLPETYLAELQLPLNKLTTNFTDVARQPYAERDLAVVVPTDVSYASLSHTVEQAAGDKLTSLMPFDVYTGSNITEGHKSLALRLRFRDDTRALRDDEVDGFMANIMTAVRHAGYDIRS